MDNKHNIRVIAIIIGKFLSMISTFVIPVILARIFDKSDYGVFSQFTTVIAFIALLFSLSFRTNLYFFFPNSKDEDKRSILIQTVGVLFILSFLAGLFLMIPKVNTLILGDKALVEYAVYIALAVVFMMISSINEPIYVYRGDLKVSMFYPAANTLFKAIFVILSLLIFKTLEAAIIAVVCSSFIVFLYSGYYISRELKHIGNGRNFNLSLLKQQINFSLPFGLSVSIRALITKMSSIMAISYLTASSYASYSIAFFAIPAIQAIYDSLVQVYTIEMTKAFQTKDYQKVISIYQDLLSKSYSYTIPIVVLVYYYADVIIRLLFTDAYLDGIPLFRIYLFAALFLVLGSGVVINATGKTKLTLRAYIYSALISLPITYFLVIKYNSFGAVISALIAVIVPVFFLMRFDIMLLKTSILEYYPWRNIGKILVISLGCFLPIFFFHMFIEKSLLWLFVCSSIYLVTISWIEIRLNLFIVENENLVNIKNKIKRLIS